MPFVLEAKPPEKWPDIPKWMSFSLLREIESCPRRWGLSHATYPDVWSQRGYPSRANIAGITGTVIHRVLKYIVDRMAENGCVSLSDANAVAVLRALGGLSSVVESEVRAGLKALRENPREIDRIDGLSQQIHMKVADIRFQVQTLFRGIEFYDNQSVRPHSPQTQAKTRGPLTGQHTELTLQVESLKWKGIIDLIRVYEQGCEILDYKTGPFKHEHYLQLQTYSLLWFLSTDLNPSRRTVDKLTLVYKVGRKQAPVLSLSELTNLERDIATRTLRALEECARQPPIALPKKEECKYCQVRHLCSDYWTDEVQRKFKRESQVNNLSVDLELKITKIHGPKSYDALCLSSS